MEWLGLLIWLLVAGLALGLALLGTLSAPSLGLQSVFVLGGLALCVVYIALGGPRWPAWGSAGLALIGAVTVGIGARTLLSDEPRHASAGQTAEEHAGTLAGATLPLLLVAAFVMVLGAAGITTVG